MGRWQVAAWALCALLAGCLGADTLVCGDLLCPAGFDCQVGSDGSDLCVPETCGNGQLDESEQCEGANLGGFDCTAFGFHEPSGLRCKANCELDAEGCARYCGDGLLDIDYEACDGDEFGDFQTCQDLGYYAGGDLKCSLACTLVTSECTGQCGDGTIDPQELCDLAAPEFETCLDYGHQAGTLACSSTCTAGLDGCVRFGWRASAVGTEANLEHLWLSGSDIIVAGSDNSLGVVATSSGAGWTVANFEDPIQALWASAPDDIYVIAAGTKLMHSSDNVVWQEVIAGTDQLTALWGSSANDIYAVGGRSNAALILHYDGTGWTKVSYSLPGIGPLDAVDGSGPASIYAVSRGGKVVHFDGSAWQELAEIAGVGVVGDVWVRAPGDVFVVGGSMIGGGLMAHLEGDQVSMVDLPNSVSLQAVWGAGEHVFAAGFQVVRYDGERAMLVATPSSGSTIQDMGGAAADDFYAVGSAGQLFHYEGVSLAPYDLNDIGGVPGRVTRQLSALWSDGQGLVYLGGATALALWDPDTSLDWQDVDHGLSPAPLEIMAIWGADADDVFFCGSGGLVRCIRYQESLGWTAIDPAVAEGNVRGLWGDPGSLLVYGVTANPNGDSQVLLGNRSSEPFSWLIAHTPAPNQKLNGIWGRSADEIYVVGDAGTIVHYNGLAWTTMESATTEDLRAVWGPPAPATDVFAAGANGTILRYDGASWVDMTAAMPLPPTLQSLSAIAGTGADDVFVFGENGAAAYYNGITWTPVDAQTPDSIRSAVSVDEGRMWLVGSAGFVRNLDRATRW